MDNKISAEELNEWTKKQTESPDRFWRMIYDSMADPVFILTNEGVILFCNEASEKFLGISQGEILGTHCYENVHKTTHFMQGCPFVKSMKSKKRESYQFLINNKWYLITIDPLINSTGIVIGAIHFITDINKVVSLNANRTNLAGIIENTGEAITGFSPAGIIEYWNFGAEEHLGYSGDEIIGKNVDILFPKDTKDNFQKIIKNTLKGEKAERFESKLISKSGEEAEVSVSIQPMYDEREVIKGISLMAHDISQERKAERELLSYITESALRLNKPVEIIRNNIEDIKNLLKSKEISEEDAEMLLNIQITNADKILENIKELNIAVVDKQKAIPAAYADFLKR